MDMIFLFSIIMVFMIFVAALTFMNICKLFDQIDSLRESLDLHKARLDVQRGDLNSLQEDLERQIKYNKALKKGNARYSKPLKKLGEKPK